MAQTTTHKQYKNRNLSLEAHTLQAFTSIMPDVDLYIKIQFIYKITLSNIYPHCKMCAKTQNALLLSVSNQLTDNKKI